MSNFYKDLPEDGSKPDLEINTVARYAFCTHEGSISIGNNNFGNRAAKDNQDNFIIVTNINESKHQHLFAVVDGHGQYGRQASLFVKMNFPKYISEKLQRSVEDEQIKAYRLTGRAQISQKQNR